MIKSGLSFFLAVLLWLQLVTPLYAVSVRQPSPSPSPSLPAAPILASDSAGIASPSADETQQLQIIQKQDLTTPEDTPEKREFLTLFSTRQAVDLTPTNFMAFFVQNSVKAGVPANTIILILLLPILATIIVFVRQIIGLPSLELIVPIALSITFVSTGPVAGAILLVSIFMAIVFSRIILKRVRIMQLPKNAISMLVVALFVFLSLTAGAMAGVLSVKKISFFPILLLVLLSDKFIGLQSTRGIKEILSITTVTLVLGFLGYLLLIWDSARNFLILYPELIFLLVPINVLIGKYFGLRLTEIYRFSYLRKHADK